jgi:hypothetical protein
VDEIVKKGYTWLLVVSRKMAEHELWSFTSALFFIILIIIIISVTLFGISTIFDIKKIKDDWANQRCKPLIMPFANMFGYNAKENFDFCMGKIFANHSQSYLGSIGSITSQFTTLLQTVFNSVNSLRNTIASLGGGINVIFQEFTERISIFFFKLRISAIYMKSLFTRIYAILFSVMYMGMSGITGMTSFTNTFLFSFLDTFCFPGETEIHVKDKGRIPIKEVRIGDVLLPGNSVVTGTFQFYSRGQPMVKLGPVTVSTNHYVLHNGQPIKAGDHPYAIQLGPWDSDELLYCLNTHDHHIPVEYLTFMDYDETSAGDKETMNWIDEKINAKKNLQSEYPFNEYGFAIQEDVKIKTERGLVSAKDIRVGDKLTNHGEIVGVIRKEINEISQLPNKIGITPSTLYWNKEQNQWKRFGESHTIIHKKEEYMSFVVIPHSQIELEDGMVVRDYMEVCSPDSELYYTKHLENNKSMK